MQSSTSFSKITSLINIFAFEEKARRFHAINPECGFSKLIAKSCLMEPSNGFLYKDKCVFGAEVFVIGKRPLVEKVSVLNLSTPYKRDWYISKFSKLESSWSSVIFSSGGYKWEIVMFPNGSSKTLIWRGDGRKRMRLGYNPCMGYMAISRSSCIEEGRQGHEVGKEAHFRGLRLGELFSFYYWISCIVIIGSSDL